MTTPILASDIDFAWSGNAKTADPGAVQLVENDLLHAWAEVMAGRCPLHRGEVLRVDPVSYSDGSSSSTLVCKAGFDFFAWDAHGDAKARVGVGLFRDQLETRRWYEEEFLGEKRRHVAAGVARVKALGITTMPDDDLERLVLAVLASQ